MVNPTIRQIIFRPRLKSPNPHAKVSIKQFSAGGAQKKKRN